MDIDTTTPVSFMNPRRPVRKWCDGYLQPGHTRKKKGREQVLIYLPASPAYLVWVDWEDFFFYK